MFYYPDKATLSRISIDYTMRDGLRMLLAKRSGDSKAPLRFAYISGGMTERDPTRSIWIKAELRRVRGEAENQLLALAESEGPGKLNLAIARPGRVLGAKDSWPAINWIMPAIIGLPLVHVDALATALVTAALQGCSRQFLENTDLVEYGKVKV